MMWYSLTLIAKRFSLFTDIYLIIFIFLANSSHTVTISADHLLACDDKALDRDFTALWYLFVVGCQPPRTEKPCEKEEKLPVTHLFMQMWRSRPDHVHKAKLFASDADREHDRRGWSSIPQRHCLQVWRHPNCVFVRTLINPRHMTANKVVCSGV